MSLSCFFERDVKEQEIEVEAENRELVRYLFNDPHLQKFKFEALVSALKDASSPRRGHKVKYIRVRDYEDLDWDSTDHSVKSLSSLFYIDGYRCEEYSQLSDDDKERIFIDIFKHDRDPNKWTYSIEKISHCLSSFVLASRPQVLFNDDNDSFFDVAAEYAHRSMFPRWYKLYHYMHQYGRDSYKCL